MYIKYCLILFLFISTFSFKKDDKKWVAIGDSITYLNDHQGETGNRVSKGYLTRVVEQLPWVHYVNKGYNGWTSGDIANQINKLNFPKADIYTILLGTNDWWNGRSIGKREDGVATFDWRNLVVRFRKKLLNLII
ncbi:SGNH/GDSL hydrolase family protein [Pedobacter sp. Leaf132]|uniref:SGNH/GDSL hydrolase family protein n=1 Tax=Pedobacter sp. Leaf132 TaxID=2876557 RepID=UPI00351CBBAB